MQSLASDPLFSLISILTWKYLRSQRVFEYTCFTFSSRNPTGNLSCYNTNRLAYHLTNLTNYMWFWVCSSPLLWSWPNTYPLLTKDASVISVLSTSSKFSVPLYQWNSAQISTFATKQKLINGRERKRVGKVKKTQKLFLYSQKNLESNTKHHILGEESCSWTKFKLSRSRHWQTSSRLTPTSWTSLERQKTTDCRCFIVPKFKKTPKMHPKH